MALVSTINAIRQANGLSLLASNPSLQSAAQTKADAIQATGNFSHSAGGSLQTLLAGVGYGYKFAGENLASNYFDDSALVQAWLNSPSHRENLLNPNYTEVGIAGSGQYVVAIFGTPRVQVIEEVRIEQATVVVQASEPTPAQETAAKETERPVEVLPHVEAVPADAPAGELDVEEVAPSPTPTFVQNFFPQAQASPSPVITIIHDTSWFGRPSDLGIYIVVLGVVMAIFAVSKFLKPSRTR